MKKLIVPMVMASSLQCVSPTVLAEGLFDRENFSANIGLTTNYLFRGITLSDNKPAVSGGFDWTYNGFYLGTWASSLKAVETESLEIDYYAGYASEFKGVSYSIDVIYYDYPGEAGSGNPADIGDLAYWEYGGSLGYAFDAILQPAIGVSVMHSPDFFAETGSATAIEGTLDLSLPGDFGLGFHYGNQDLNKKYNDISGYNYYGVALTKAIGFAELTLGYSDTDSDGEKFQGGSTDQIYFTITASM